jgi:hypothetical protein
LGKKETSAPLPATSNLRPDRADRSASMRWSGLEKRMRRRRRPDA